MQYPSNTEKVYSYFESRGGDFKYSLFYGLQYILKKYLEGPVVNRRKINEARSLFKLHFNGNESLFNQKGWEYILNRHKGKFPVSIKAVAEGTKVATSNVLITVENTDPMCYWLTNYGVRIIQGNRVDIDILTSILKLMKRKKWSADNISFGMGSALLQKLNSDTQEFAFKCSVEQRNGRWHDVFKEPVTDPDKNSKRGRFKLIKTDKGFKSVRFEDKGKDQLTQVFRDGRILKEYNFEDVIKNSKNS